MAVVIWMPQVLLAAYNITLELQEILKVLTFPRKAQMLLLTVSVLMILIKGQLFNTNSNLATHLSNQRYSVCIRREANMCAICYTATEPMAVAEATQGPFGVRYTYQD